jgi:hypothetical protein
MTRTSSILSLIMAVLSLVCLPKASFAQESYPFPGRAENLPPGHYWFLQSVHKQVGFQTEAYDLGAGIRFDQAQNKWVGTKPGASGDSCATAAKNSDCIIYGQPVYAIADGEVEVCWRNTPENPRPGIEPSDIGLGSKVPGGGNLLWVDIGSGRHVLYAHMIPASIPASLCPIDDVFLSPLQQGKLPVGNRPTVKQGQMIGLVGNSGNSSRPHLHIHLELRDASGKTLQALPLRFHGAWVKSQTLPTDVSTDWQKLTGATLSSPPTVILPAYSSGFQEVAKHGVPGSEYQFTFEQIAGSGYRPEWVDGFDHNGKIFFNVVFRPSDGAKWPAFHNLTAAQYQAHVNQLTQAGFHLYQVDSYPVGNQVRYAAIFTNKPGLPTTAYHGVSASVHQQRFEQLTGGGWRPKNISVVSIQGNRFYTALYEKGPAGSFEARSFLTAAQYQQEVIDNDKIGRQLVYLNVYQHNGQPRFSAIWKSGITGPFKARHGLSSSAYQAEWESATDNGLLTRAVTGYSEDNSIRYAAVWGK